METLDPLSQDSNATTDPPMRPNHNAVAEAIERRLREEREQQAAQQAAHTSYNAFDENHEKRQEFRRLIDPGILRPNARNVAMESLHTLLKLAENILEHPNEPKYQRFKPTNSKIKATLVDPAGSMEYAVALGFRTEVENFQPFYAFNKHRMGDLRIGIDILKEAIERESTKEERAVRARREEKAVADAAIAKVKQAFIDDRKSKAYLDRREKERAATASRRESSSIPSSPIPPVARMPRTGGHTLSGSPQPDIDSPPPYIHVNDEDD